MVDVLSDVFLESFRVCQKFVKELAGYILLNAMILGDDPRVEVLPERSSAAPPLRAVRREREDGVEAPSVGQAVSDRSPREVLGSWNEGSHFYYGCLFPV